MTGNGRCCRYIDIDVVDTHKSVQNRLKLAKKLHLVKQNVVHFVIDKLLLDIGVKHLRVTEFLVFKAVEGDFNDVALVRAAFEQVFLKKRKQQIGLSAATYSRHNLYQTVVLFCYQFVEVIISLYFHCKRSY